MTPKPCSTSPRNSGSLLPRACVRGARRGAAALCAAAAFAAFAQAPEIGVVYRCDDGNEARIASCAGSICDVEFGPSGRLVPYLRMSPAGAATFLARQRCVSPDGNTVEAPAPPRPGPEKPAPRPEAEAASGLGGMLLPLVLLALAAALVWPFVARARRSAGSVDPIAQGNPSAPAAPAQTAKSACNTCSGRGNVSCPQCRGRRGEWVGPSGSTQWQSCWSCGGSGETRCTVCNGAGYSQY